MNALIGMVIICDNFFCLMELCFAKTYLQLESFLHMNVQSDKVWLGKKKRQISIAKRPLY